MSFIKRAGKKVFKFFKRAVKSTVFKWVAIAALTLFTAGVAAGGFASFAGVASAGGGVGAFFTAVGQTMATGAASVASALGWQGGVNTFAAHGGASAIQAGFVSTATSATGEAIGANALTGQIVKDGGAALTSRGAAVELSAKALAHEQAVAASSLAGVPQYSVAADGTPVLATTGGGSVDGVFQSYNAASTGIGQVQNALTTTGTSAGMSSNVWKGIQVGFAAMASSAARSEKRGRTFVAGGLSHGGSSELGPQPFFAIGGREVAEPDGPLDISQAPRASSIQGESVAGELARRDSASSAHQIASYAQAPSNVVVRGAPQPGEEGDEGAEQGGILQQAMAANEAPAGTSTQEFFKEYPSTDIRNLGNRMGYKGLLAGLV